MDNNTHDNVLNDLLAQIDRAWMDHKDRAIVDRLSKEHPEFGEDLHDFFADLILGSDEQLDRDRSTAEDNVHAWVVRSGLDIARAARSSTVTHVITPVTSSHSPPSPHITTEEHKEL